MFNLKFSYIIQIGIKTMDMDYEPHNVYVN